MYSDQPRNHTCPELTEQEFKRLSGIVNQIRINMKKLKGGSYAFSECEFIFDIDNGVYRAFITLIEKFDRISSERGREILRNTNYYQRRRQGG